MLTTKDMFHLCSYAACVIGLLAFPIAGCSDSGSGAAGSGGAAGLGGNGGDGGIGGAGGVCDPATADPVTVFFDVVEHREGSPPLEGVQICEVGTDNCTMSNEEGKAELDLPGCEEVAWTLDKEGYDPATGADVTDDTFQGGPWTWSMRTIEEIEGWTEILDTSYPWETAYLRAFPRQEGVTFELVGETNRPFYMAPTDVPDPDLTATSSFGDGGFVELSPGVVEIEFGGAAIDCVASLAWTSERPNTIRLPIFEGRYTYGSMRCSEE